MEVLDVAGLKSCIDGHLQSGKHVIVFLDGMAGSGKTTLAGQLTKQYACNLINMDSFFLRPEQRTPGRLVEVGGNIDYERFIKEVIVPLLRFEEFSYRPYDCGTQELTAPVTVSPKQLTIIEGVYSLHPKIMSALDTALDEAQAPDVKPQRNNETIIIRVFMKISIKEQRKRLMVRNPELFGQFENQWLPMENSYFEHFAIQDTCDYVLGEQE